MTRTDETPSSCRVLHNAEGILVAFRRYTPDAALQELTVVAEMYDVERLDLAQALVHLAARTENSRNELAAIARREWGWFVRR